MASSNPSERKDHVTQELHKTPRGARRAALITALAFSTSFAGCATDGSLEDDLAPETGRAPEASRPTERGLTGDDESKLVASYVAPDGRQLKFVEDEPGYIIMVQAGDIGSRPLVSREMASALAPEAIYARLSGRAAPEALIAASRRAGPRKQPTAEQLQALEAAEAADEAEIVLGDGTVGSISQPLFDDSWLWDRGICWSGNDNILRFRNDRHERDMVHHEKGGGESIVFNTDSIANITGSCKIRTWYTLSSGYRYNIGPNQYTSCYFDYPNSQREIDIKTYIDPHGSAYTACQYASEAGAWAI
jgi:hypothetical protein